MIQSGNENEYVNPSELAERQKQRSRFGVAYFKRNSSCSRIVKQAFKKARIFEKTGKILSKRLIFFEYGYHISYVEFWWLAVELSISGFYVLFKVRIRFKKFLKECVMKQSHCVQWVFALVSLLLIIVGDNMYFIFAASEDCENKAATDGACTSCDNDYLATNTSCWANWPCAGSGYYVTNYGLSTTKLAGSRISNSITIACLRGITCVEDEWEDDGGFIHVGCINSLVQQLSTLDYE
ncbi:MAG: hypothetical protein FWH27_14195 [Planctomycetaceae bacterium]|nr:hypothetical protein [Planctomycetaceae bacterium]